MKSYDMVEEKSLEIQKIVNFFMMYISSVNNNNNVQQSVNCAELHRTLFIEIVLKDEAIRVRDFYLYLRPFWITSASYKIKVHFTSRPSKAPSRYSTN